MIASQLQSENPANQRFCKLILRDFLSTLRSHFLGDSYDRDDWWWVCCRIKMFWVRVIGGVGKFY